MDKSGKGQFDIKNASLPLRCPAPAGQAVQLGLRPEHIRLDDTSPWRGQVGNIEPTGADTYVVVRTDAGDITVRVAPHSTLTVGQTVGLAVAADRVNWFDAETGQRLAG